MDVLNETPFPCVAWESFDCEKDEYLTTLLRVKYVFHQTKSRGKWELRLTPEQGELFMEDKYYNDDLNSSIQYESDFVTYKPNTDVILNAVAKTNIAKQQWSCGVNIFDPQQSLLKTSQLEVQAPCQTFKKRLVGWVDGEREKAREVAIRYENAYGGTIENPDPETREESPFLAQHEHNFVGTGITHKEMEGKIYAVPQITWRDKEPQRSTTPAGFGCINRGWQPRIGYAGTYDEKWLKEQHPYPPHNFNYYHHQAANPELICDGYLNVGSYFELENLISPDSRDQFKLPELYCFSDIEDKRGDLQRLLMNIDTVLIDIDAEDVTDWSVYLSYRSFIRAKSTFKKITFKYLPKEQLEKQRSKNGKNEFIKKELKYA